MKTIAIVMLTAIMSSFAQASPAMTSDSSSVDDLVNNLISDLNDAVIADLRQRVLETSDQLLPYLENYLQCLNDEQALQADESAGLTELLEQLQKSGSECQPILDELNLMLETTPQEEGEQNLQDLIDQST